jgi:hypothetical protein
MRTSIAARVASAGSTWPSAPVPKAPALRNLSGGTDKKEVSSELRAATVKKIEQ